SAEMSRVSVSILPMPHPQNQLPLTPGGREIIPGDLVLSGEVETNLAAQLPMPGAGQLRSGSRMLTKLATAAPPMLRMPASEAPGICMSPASPVSCIEARTCIETPVAPTGCPFDLSPPDGLT